MIRENTSTFYFHLLSTACDLALENAKANTVSVRLGRVGLRFPRSP